MTSKVYAVAVIGLEATLVEVEADTLQSLPGIFIVGLPDKSVDESRERIKSAFKNSRLELPRTKVIINLAPADLKKEGPGYDLPIAISILLATKQVRLPQPWGNYLMVGELGLDGSVRPVSGILSMCLEARRRGVTTVVVPEANAAEAGLVDRLTIVPIRTLGQLIEGLRGKSALPVYERVAEPVIDHATPEGFDLGWIAGQEQAKRALEIAAAGGHNVLFLGPPGSGKTLLARTLSTILPPLSKDEALEVTRIYSSVGLLPHGQPLCAERPFRSPHHSASGVALVGGGTLPRPGEISLAHRGILFLDELPEFGRAVLETLRQPLEEGVVTVSRAAGTLHFPAKFTLVAAMNPCPCGYASDAERTCTCLPSQLIRYKKKISGPLLDRIDLHLEVPRVKLDQLSGQTGSEQSAVVRKRVIAAWERQQERFAETVFRLNAEMPSRLVRQYCQLDQRSSDLLRQAAARLALSARSYFRVLKVARTVADLAGCETVGYTHVAEALAYRPKLEV